MTIIRAPRPESNFYLLDKRLSEDGRLSWAARGLLIFLLGKPDNWKVSIEHLRKQTCTARIRTGRGGIYSLLAELQVAGYVTPRRDRDQAGRLGEVDYIVSETPHQPDPKVVLPQPADPEMAAPHPAQPDMAPPRMAKTTLVRTEVATKTENTNHREQERVQPPAAPCRFAEFWATYPNKKGKQEAEKAWRRMNLDSRCHELIAHVRMMAATDDGWQRGYIPMGSTYITQARWEDEPAGPSIERTALSAVERVETNIRRNRALREAERFEVDCIEGEFRLLPECGNGWGGG